MNTGWVFRGFELNDSLQRSCYACSKKLQRGDVIAFIKTNIGMSGWADVCDTDDCVRIAQIKLKLLHS